MKKKVLVALFVLISAVSATVFFLNFEQGAIWQIRQHHNPVSDNEWLQINCLTGNPEKQIPHFEKALIADPKNLYMKNELARCYALVGRSDDARRLFSEVAEVKSVGARAFVLEAQEALSPGKIEQIYALAVKSKTQSGEYYAQLNAMRRQHEAVEADFIRNNGGTVSDSRMSGLSQNKIDALTQLRTKHEKLREDFKKQFWGK